MEKSTTTESQSAGTTGSSTAKRAEGPTSRNSSTSKKADWLKKLTYLNVALHVFLYGLLLYGVYRFVLALTPLLGTLSGLLERVVQEGASPEMSFLLWAMNAAIFLALMSFFVKVIFALLKLNRKRHRRLKRKLRAAQRGEEDYGGGSEW